MGRRKPLELPLNDFFQNKALLTRRAFLFNIPKHEIFSRKTAVRFCQFKIGVGRNYSGATSTETLTKRELIMLQKVLSLVCFGALLVPVNAMSFEQFKGIELERLISPAGVHGKSICGEEDEREFSDEAPVGRAQVNGRLGGCSITMIGRTCAISAGHCLRTFDEIHFNTGMTRDDEGELILPTEENVYNVDQDSIVHEYLGVGKDYAVIRLKQNEMTGQWPGDVQGSLEVSFDEPSVGDVVRITGYGVVPDNPKRTFTQQTHTGPLTEYSVESGIIRHQADTTGGNSGSAVVDEATGKIIGVHTHAGCFSFGGANRSTLIAGNDKLQEAVRSCLQWEEENL